MPGKLVKIAAGIGALALPAAAVGIPAMASASVKPPAKEPAKVLKSVRVIHGTPAHGALAREMRREVREGHGRINPDNCQGWYNWDTYSTFSVAQDVGWTLESHQIIVDYNVDSDTYSVPGNGTWVTDYQLEVLDPCT